MLAAFGSKRLPECDSRQPNSWGELNTRGSKVVRPARRSAERFAYLGGKFQSRTRALLFHVVGDGSDEGFTFGSSFRRRTGELGNEDRVGVHPGRHGSMLCREVGGGGRARRIAARQHHVLLRS